MQLIRKRFNIMSSYLMSWNSLHCLWDIQRVPVLSVTINNANKSSSMPRQCQSKNSVQISVVQTILKISNLKILQVWNTQKKMLFFFFCRTHQKNKLMTYFKPTAPNPVQLALVHTFRSTHLTHYNWYYCLFCAVSGVPHALVL